MWKSSRKYFFYCMYMCTIVYRYKVFPFNFYLFPSYSLGRKVPQRIDRRFLCQVHICLYNVNVLCYILLPKWLKIYHSKYLQLQKSACLKWTFVHRMINYKRKKIFGMCAQCWVTCSLSCHIPNNVKFLYRTEQYISTLCILPNNSQIAHVPQVTQYQRVGWLSIGIVSTCPINLNKVKWLGSREH